MRLLYTEILPHLPSLKRDIVDATFAADWLAHPSRLPGGAQGPGSAGFNSWLGGGPLLATASGASAAMQGGTGAAASSSLPSLARAVPDLKWSSAQLLQVELVDGSTAFVHLGVVAGAPVQPLPLFAPACRRVHD